MNPLRFGAMLLQASLLFGTGWVIASVVLQAFGDVSRRESGDGFSFVEFRFGAPERALISIAAGIAWCVVLMVGHIVSGGIVFESRVAVPLLTMIVVVWGVRRRGRDVARLSRPSLTSLKDPKVLAGFALALVLLALYVVPIVSAGSGVRTGDSPWHLGWTEQLLAGERVPTGPAPEFGRNAYPWGFHAVMATSVRLVPGTQPLDALGAIHLLILAGVPLGAAVLARRVTRAAGWFAAVAVSLIGGFGWIVSGGPEFSTTPAGGRLGADLVVASPNSVYELLPPALPRELGLVLLAAAATLLLLESRSGPKPDLIAGAAVGLVGLISVPMFVSACAWSLAYVWSSGRGGRLSTLLPLLAGAVPVFGLWAVPVAIEYATSGGFVDITPRLGREWPLWAALASWGVLLPLAVLGFVTARRSQPESARRLVLLALASGVLLLLALARGAWDWDLYGNATVLHQGRVWPPVHLLGAVFAGIGLAWAFERALKRSRKVALGAAAALVVIGAISPVFASLDLTSTMREGQRGFIYAENDVTGRGSFVQSAAALLGPGDVVEVQGSDELAFLLFQFSGARLADYDHPNLETNDLRIRFAERAESWQERVDGPGFTPTVYAVEREEALPDAEVVASGSFMGREWVLVRSDQIGSIQTG